MECKEWDNQGLLFANAELNEEGMRLFEAHLEKCELCRKEYDLYEYEKKTFFNPEMFEESPSAAVDKEIIRVCSKPFKPAVFFAFSQSFFKNAFFAMLFLIIGFGGGVYFSGVKVVTDIRGKDKQIADKTNQQKSIESSSALVSNQHENNEGEPDLKSDSNITDLSDSASQFNKRRGNLSMQGVVPVDLEE